MNEIKEMKSQALMIGAVLGLALAAIVVRLWQVQVIDSASYRRLAQINAARTMPVIAPRGVIYDRYGKLLVGNKPVFSVYVLQSETKNRQYLIKKLAALLSMQAEEIEKRLNEKKARPFDPVIIKENTPIDAVTRIEEERSGLEGVVVSVRPVRVYPNKSIAAHVLGYIGEVTALDIEKDSGKLLGSGDLIGKAGIEKIYDAYLRGSNGGERASINIFGSSGQMKDAQESVPGKNLKLTIDLDLQKTAEKALGSSNGAVVVLDPSNGDVLALVSHPSYDPNIFSGPISPSTWKQLSGGNHPFLNRALSVYPPGSIFKAITISAVLERALAKPGETFFCPGYFKLGQRTAKCWKTKGHGTLTLMEGLVQSCDIVFYNMGLRAGPDRLADLAKGFGLGERTGIDLPSEAKGVVPDSAWKKRVYKEPWYPGDSINYGIGQGFLWVTPLQMVNVYASIANGIARFEPHLVTDIRDREGEEIYLYKPKRIGDVPVSQKNLVLVRSALHDVVSRGTGRAARIITFEAAGKTGTAENPRKPPHAWFVCYAPYNEPQIAIAAFVEHGMHGDQVTARIAHDILKWYLDNRVSRTGPDTRFP
ncbi:MAG: penicillin-binding protein 2 [Candidatus Saganbacteria bacterium]|nr:penicillin-binding protein 2 [Candidatus Saganbacteria bacterium]